MWKVNMIATQFNNVINKLLLINELIHKIFLLIQKFVVSKNNLLLYYLLLNFFNNFTLSFAVVFVERVSLEKI